MALDSRLLKTFREWVLPAFTCAKLVSIFNSTESAFSSRAGFRSFRQSSSSKTRSTGSIYEVISPALIFEMSRTSLINANKFSPGF